MKCSRQTYPRYEDRETCPCDGCAAWRQAVHCPLPPTARRGRAKFTYEDDVVRIMDALRAAAMTSRGASAHIVNYGPRLIDMAMRLDRAEAENEVFKRVIDMVATKQENDELRKRVADLEAEIAKGGCIY